MKREEQKIEAIARMKLLKLHENPIRELEEENVINQSVTQGDGVTCYNWLTITL